MGYTDDVRLLLEIARLYYEEGAKQEDIARNYNISRSLVSKYLTKARTLGLVEIIIHDEQLRPKRHLEDKLKRMYPILEVICVSSDGVETEERRRKRIGIAAAKYLARVMEPEFTVAVAAGHYVHAAASHFSPSLRLQEATFVPAVGGLGHKHADIQASVISAVFARRCGAKYLELHAPVLVDSAKAREVFLKQPFIQDVLQRARMADIAVVGIGGTPAYVEMTGSYLYKIDHQADVDLTKVAGDICYNFIDSQGNLVDCDWNRQALAITLEEIRRIPMVIGVAGGWQKAEGIKAALEGELIDVLITDEECLQRILRESTRN